MAIRFKLRQLEMFIAVAKVLNFREAAAALHMTQPPLSRQIAELEHGLGVRLFERSRVGVALTPAGALFLEEARKLIAACEAMSRRFSSSIADPARELKIGLTSSVDTETLQHILPYMQSAIPNLNISFTRQSSVKSVRGLQRNRIDAAIIGMPSRTDDLAVRKLYRDPFCVALSTGHRLRNRRKISLMDLNEETVFWFGRELNPHFYDRCESLFRDIGFSPKRALEPADHHVLLGLIANRAGIGLIPRSLQKIRRSGVVYRELVESDRLFIDVSIAYPTPLRDPLVALFIDKLVQYCDREHAAS